MTDQTRLTLNAMNQSFYQEQAESWTNSRQYYWPSWYRFWDLSQAKENAHGRVLDVGCGSGRLAGFWQEQLMTLDQDWEYLGADISTLLLEHARLEYPSTLQLAVAWRWVDVCVPGQMASALEEKFDVIALFGVLHHIPGQSQRLALLRKLAQALKPGGEIWLTTWQPHRAGDSGPHEVSVSEVAQQHGFEEQDLEPGDAFLGWKDSAAIRYVHWWQEEEDALLTQDTGLTVVSHWTQNEPGERGNLCWLLRREA